MYPAAVAVPAVVIDVGITIGIVAGDADDVVVTAAVAVPAVVVHIGITIGIVVGIVDIIVGIVADVVIIVAISADFKTSAY